MTTYTIHYTSALSGNRFTSTCLDKRHALRDAKALFQEGARDIRVCKFSNGLSIDIDWRKALRGRI